MEFRPTHDGYHELMRIAESKMRALDYHSALNLFGTASATAIMLHDQAAERQAVHMSGICLRCIGKYVAAIAAFKRAHDLAESVIDQARIKRDEMMVYLKRFAEGDNERTCNAIEESIATLEQACEAALSDTTLQAELKCSIGFRARYRAKVNDAHRALADYEDARYTLKDLHPHYYLNNEIYFVKFLCGGILGSGGRRHKRMYGRLLALQGAVDALRLRHNGRPAGSWKRSVEFLALFFGGNTLHESAAQLVTLKTPLQARLWALLKKK